MISKAAAAAAIWLLTVPVLASTSVSAQPAKTLTEDQKIVHVWTRLGFGARPGDLGPVTAAGSRSYPSAVNAALIDESGREAEVKGSRC